MLLVITNHCNTSLLDSKLNNCQAQGQVLSLNEKLKIFTNINIYQISVWLLLASRPTRGTLLVNKETSVKRSKYFKKIKNLCQNSHYKQIRNLTQEV